MGIFTSAKLIAGRRIADFSTSEYGQLERHLLESVNEQNLVRVSTRYDQYTHVGIEVDVPKDNPVGLFHNVQTALSLFEFMTGKKAELLVLPHVE